MKNESEDKHQKETSEGLRATHAASSEDRVPHARAYSVEDCMRLATQEYDTHVNYAEVLLAYLDGVRTSR